MNYTKKQKKILIICFIVIIVSITALAIILNLDRNMLKNSEQSVDLETIKIEQQDIANQFITQFYNYDTENYVSRMYEVKKLVAPDVLQVLLDGETDIENLQNTDAANLDMKSEVAKLDIYSHDTAAAKGYVYIIMNYKITVSGMEQDNRNMILDLEIQKNSDNTWVVTGISMLGEGNTEKLANIIERA